MGEFPDPRPYQIVAAQVVGDGRGPGQIFGTCPLALVRCVESAAILEGPKIRLCIILAIRLKSAIVLGANVHVCTAAIDPLLAAVRTRKIELHDEAFIIGASN